MVGYHYFQRLVTNPALKSSFGVKMVHRRSFRSSLEDIPEEHERMTESVAGGISGFRRSTSIITR